MGSAWASVAYIQDQLWLGWFVRGLHSFGSSALIVVAGVHLLQALLYGAYRRPRELNWIVGLALLGVSVLFALTGYLLPWDQKGYWAKLVEATITGSAPVIGPAAQQLIQGGSGFGNLTLTHAFAAHAIALPFVLFGLIALHVWLYRRHGPTPRWTLTADAAAAITRGRSVGRLEGARSRKGRATTNAVAIPGMIMVATISSGPSKYIRSW